MTSLGNAIRISNFLLKDMMKDYIDSSKNASRPSNKITLLGRSLCYLLLHDFFAFCLLLVLVHVGIGICISERYGWMLTLLVLVDKIWRQ
jgi:hypothetical protein